MEKCSVLYNGFEDKPEINFTGASLRPLKYLTKSFQKPSAYKWIYVFSNVKYKSTTR